MAWVGGVLLALCVMLAILASISNWNGLRGPIAGFASTRLHRKVTIEGDLSVHLWSLEPSATVDRVRVENPAWAGKSSLAEIDRIAVQVRLAALLTGRIDLRLLEFDRARLALYRDPTGKASWDFSDGAKPNEPLRLPPIHKFVIDGGKLNYIDDQRKLRFSGSIDAHELGSEGRQGFQLTGKGALNNEPFALQLTGGPLINIDRKKPYPFSARIEAGETHIAAAGAVPKPFDLAQFYMDVVARGPDLADLYRVTDVPFPNTPPYTLRGRLSRDLHIWKFDGIGGKVGSSDLTGSLSIRTGGERPFLTADLRSQNLNFPDLGALFGGTRKTGVVASAKQIAVARVMQAQQRIFPYATLDFSRIRRIDADVTFKAAEIVNAPVHLRSASTRLKLNAGVLRAEPLELELPQGKVTGFVQLNGRSNDAVTDLDLRLLNGRLESLLPLKFQGATPFTGRVVGRVKLHGVGDSVHDAVADADGEVLFVASDGEFRKSLAELAGLDVIKGLGLFFAKDQSMTPLRCGVLHFTARNGVFSADRLIIDTDPMLIDGGGVINLDTETLAFKVRGHPKTFQLLRVMAPINVSGQILHPQVHVEKGQAIAQAGAAVALSAVLSPVAVLLPFVDAGLAKNPSCAGQADVSKAATAQTKGASPAKAAPNNWLSRLFKPAR